MLHREIKITGAREHNLKNINVTIPKDCLTVITGPSGSGKSSLAFDTLYAEGQRRYVESLSSYARQFLGVQKKPDLDDIEGLSPAISIEQKGVSHNPRSTVGTVTETYDYLRLLYSRIGVPLCPSCGASLHRHSVDEMVSALFSDYGDSRIELMAPVVRGKKGAFKNLFVDLRKKGFLRVRVDDEVYWLEEDLELDKNKSHHINVVIDRLKVLEDRRSRIAEGLQTALDMSDGFASVVIDGENTKTFTERYVCPDCGDPFPDLEPRLFSFNSPFGACPDCSGIGSHRYFTEELAVVPDLPLAGGALLPWKKNHYMLRRLAVLLGTFDLDMEKVRYADLTEDQRDLVLNGSEQKLPLTFERNGDISSYMGRYEGLLPWLERRWNESESEAVKEELLRYRYEDLCQSCGGLRLKRESLSVIVAGKNIGELVSMPVEDLLSEMKSWELGQRDLAIVGQILVEMIKRLEFLVQVGAGYLSLNRRADSLSGGESQRIRLATQIGSKLTGVLYVLDEPTIGLHPKDTGQLIETLKTIRDLGNTVVVVEHDRDIMIAADYLVEMGPAAGDGGGYLVKQGYINEFNSNTGLTGPYITGKASGLEGKKNKKVKLNKKLIITGAAENNLKKLKVSFPLGVLACLTGVSGSGKSTLLYDVIYKGLRRLIDPTYRGRPGVHSAISGWEDVKKVVMVDQSPIGRTPRSNPATYTGIFTHIREFYSSLPEAKIRGFKPGRFSFNVRGGRCEACRGAGVKKVSMLFMPDVYVECEVCDGKRYNRETLEVKYRGKTISDVLNMTVDEAVVHFSEIPAIVSRLIFIQDAGLGYIKLGQSALTLSGGEAQRVKLAKELGRRLGKGILYLLDEPTTGLFYTDVKKLIDILRRLVNQGNSIIVIEHNLDVICSCDHITDLGPDGGVRGGALVDSGTPEDIGRRGRGYTGKHIETYMKELEATYNG